MLYATYHLLREPRNSIENRFRFHVGASAAPICYNFGGPSRHGFRSTGWLVGWLVHRWDIREIRNADFLRSKVLHFNGVKPVQLETFVQMFGIYMCT